MARQIQLHRLLFLVLLLGLAFAGLGYRLVDLQVLRHEDLRARARELTESETVREPRRGDILDAKGNLLATSVFVKTICANPSLIGNREAEVARTVAPFLQLPEGEIYNRLLQKVRLNDKGETVPKVYVVLKAKVPIETWQKIQAAMSKLTFGVDESKLKKAELSFYRDLRAKGVFADPFDDQIRVYPSQALAAHVLGYTSLEESVNNGHQLRRIRGKDGIEASFDDKLAGARGWRETERDRLGREMVVFRKQDVEAQDGLDVVLTIDSVVQHTLESALAEGMEKNSPISISGIVVRPRTGEVLAMATLPNFDPNHPGADEAARRNRIIADVMEPGSTFKIVTISGALNDQLVRLSDMFDCEHGHFAFAGRVLHDHESYGPLSVQSIITKSSNIGAAKVGIKMGGNRLYDYMCNYGFGVRTGIELPGEVKGILHEVKDWSKVTIAQIPMGHGVAVTRLQMAMAMCAIANKGTLMRPFVVSRLQDRDGKVIAQYTPQRVRQVISESAARDMVTALKTVVSAEGTAPKAALEHYTVAGKTGTAQKAGPGGYIPGKYVASFVGFFPADDPELCISIVMDEPRQGYYGGQTAAPLFRQVAERAANYLNIRPDLGEERLASNGAPAVLPNSPAIRPAASRSSANP